MKLSLLAPFALAAAMPAAALAQDTATGPTVAPGNALLTVSAQGETSSKPDLAVFSAGVSSTGKTAGEALNANSAAMNRAIAALKRAGIANRDIQTSNLSLNPVYAQRKPSPSGQYEQELPEIIGYRAENTVTVKQRNLDEYGKVIDTLVAAGANQVNGPSFQLDYPERALDLARTEALKKARARAELYASAAGLKVARILSISESGSYSPPPMPYARMAAADAAESTPIAPGEVALNASVTVQFELSR